jgi:hypothetical protein
MTVCCWLRKTVLLCNEPHVCVRDFGYCMSRLHTAFKLLSFFLLLCPPQDKMAVTMG